MTSLPHIASLVLNRPLAILPSKLETIAAVLGGRIGLDASGLTPQASRFVGSHVDREAPGSQGSLPYRRTAAGTAIIPVIGSTVNRGAWIGASSGLVSYEGLKFQLAHASQDDRTRAVLLDFECPGGEAVGAFEAAAVVRQVAALKPVVAVVNGLCASAAYAMASGATRIVTTPSGIAGSIGVVMLHTDVSGALAKAGVKPTLIFAGKHKTDGHPYGPLPDSVKADLRAEIEGFYAAFINCVATGRKNLTAEAIRGTEARTFMGAAAVAAGLADEVGTFEGALVDLEAGRITLATAQGTPAVTQSTRPAGSAAASHDDVVAKLNAGLKGRHGAVIPGSAPTAPANASPAASSGGDIVARLNAALPRGAYIPEKAR
ncbi:S49 family peptidase [Methylobacterium radiotolerans]|uniref:Peptidase S49 n=1 Tax=Methylobacterium radiotolerans (strain ATCC 27329 / DSM 1819 / JCM 2831 / NBRC 15690 / NCIMB 10815 / 0-1) TaxID=426355 RepID=B1MAB7_METRJ|nr:S49 family peptidase [Methylobacterium radiotolerans]ACB28442.1 peptidase S49 [Methylobacterium radiotolerans JCM 2831]GEN01726.1 serine peptidase [Methylobacterium radiotolerans]